HLVRRLAYLPIGVECTQLEDLRPVREPYLAVLEIVCVGLRLRIFAAARVVHTKQGGELPMIFVIAESEVGTEFSRGRHPPECARQGCEVPVELSGIDAQRR